MGDGRHDYDNRSFAHNEETSVCFREPALAARLERDFEHDAASAERVRLDVWRRRGTLNRTCEFIASLLREQV